MTTPCHHPRRRLFLASLALLGLLAGCQNLGGLHRNVPIAGMVSTPDPDAPLGVDVQNRKGTVRVVVDPRVRQPHVRAIRVAPADERTRRGKRAAPSPGPVDTVAAAQLLTVDGRAVLRVLADQPFEDYADWATQIEIRLPRCQGVRVRNTDGPVELVNVEGAIDVDNGAGNGPGGHITLRTDRPISDPVLLATPRGDIRAVFGHGSALAIDAQTQYGSVNVDARRQAIDHALAQRLRWQGQVNQGTAPAHLTTGNGLIWIDFASPPRRRR